MLNYVHKDDCKIEVFTPVLKNDAIGLNTLYSFSSGMLNVPVKSKLQHPPPGNPPGI